jgi:hypothetical protein
MNSLRPDEKVALGKEQRTQGTKDLLRGGLGLAAGIGGAALSAKVLPFLNEVIPTDLAIKGINKISPKLGSFLRNGVSAGLDAKEGLRYVKDKILPSESKQEQAQDERNIIQQYDPELHEYISQNIKKGMSPVQAGQKALRHERFQKAIRQIEKDHRTKISQILQSIYGSQDMGQSGNIQQQAQAPVQQQAPQQGNANQALLEALKNAAEARKRRVVGG